VFVSKSESEGSDQSDIDLSSASNSLISAVTAANPNTVVVVNSGSAVTMPWLSSVKGVLEAWYPGQQDGNAIAALLFGTDPAASGQPPRQLEGFARVNLQPGQSQTVTLRLTEQNLRYWNANTNRWATSTGTYGAVATDFTSGQTPTFSATGLPAGISISSTGAITGTPTTTGTSTVTVTAQDGTGASNSTSFVWTVAP